MGAAAPLRNRRIGPVALATIAAPRCGPSIRRAIEERSRGAARRAPCYGLPALGAEFRSSTTLRRRLAILAVLALAVSACQARAPHPRALLGAEGLSEAAVARLAARMDPSARALARRHDPGRRGADFWGRPVGWETLDIATIPDMGFSRAAPETAQQINDLRPFANLPIHPMRPFVLRAGVDDARRALECLSQAVYFEAAREPRGGQEAVAQVVLNRLRHPAYPKSVCGVVYQGAARATGCQFTFTCDGALAWAPEPRLWAKAQAVAKRALAGYVDKEVGPATHYHADYVAPYWAPTLVKLNKVGAHIFYRWTGPWGEPPAFNGRYAGGEGKLTLAVLGGVDPRTQGGLFAPERMGLGAGRKVTLNVAGEVRTYTVVDASAAGGEKTRVLGTIVAPRRRPTAAEVREINANLNAMERNLEAAAPAPTPATIAPPAAPAE
jgi:spore germination cell wall hydrolase CwlJ-like protein